jgi:hypothetical protein
MELGAELGKAAERTEPGRRAHRSGEGFRVCSWAAP